METASRREFDQVQNRNMEAYGFLEVISGQFDNRGEVIPHQVNVFVNYNMFNYYR